MIDDNLKAQLAAYLQHLQHPVEIVASLDERAASDELRALLAAIAPLSPLLSRWCWRCCRPVGTRPSWRPR